MEKKDVAQHHEKPEPELKESVGFSMFGSVKSNGSGLSESQVKNDSFKLDEFASKVSGEKRESIESQRLPEKQEKDEINFNMFGSVKSANKEEVDFEQFASKVSRESFESQIPPEKVENSIRDEINFSMFGSVKSANKEEVDFD